MKIDSKLADIAILQELGQRIKSKRLSMSLTQAILAKQSGVSKRTVERIEDGNSSELINIIRISRVLDFLENLELLIEDQAESPIELVKLQTNKPKRASVKRKKIGKQASWKWNDD